MKIRNMFKKNKKEKTYDKLTNKQRLIIDMFNDKIKKISIEEILVSANIKTAESLAVQVHRMNKKYSFGLKIKWGYLIKND